MSLRTIVEQQQALIAEYRTIMEVVNGIPRFVDVNKILSAKDDGLERLIHANRRNDKEVKVVTANS